VDPLFTLFLNSLAALIRANPKKLWLPIKVLTIPSHGLLERLRPFVSNREATGYMAFRIKDYQAAHDISKPLDSLPAAKRNAVLAAVCTKIEAVANPSIETFPEDSLKDAVPQSAPPAGQKPERPYWGEG
jgi:hypothetical protein